MSNISSGGAQVSVGMAMSQTNTLNDGRTITEQIGSSSLFSDSLDAGSDAGGVDRGWQLEEITLTSGSSLVIDLYAHQAIDIGAGPGNIGLGLAENFVEITTIFIVNNAGPGSLEVQPDAFGPWTFIGSRVIGATDLSIREGGCYLLHQPDDVAFPVTAVTAHRIKLTATGGNVTFSFYQLGRHDTEQSSSSSVSSSSSSSSSLSSSSSSPSSSSLSSSQSSSSPSSLSSKSTSSSSRSSVSTSSSSRSSISTSSASSSSSSRSSISTSSASSSSSSSSSLSSLSSLSSSSSSLSSSS